MVRHTDGEQIIQEARQVLQVVGTIQEKPTKRGDYRVGKFELLLFCVLQTNILPKKSSPSRGKFPEISVVITDYDRYAEEQALREGRQTGLTILPTTAEFETWEPFRMSLWHHCRLEHPDMPLSWRNW